MSNAFNWLMKHGGIMSREDYPYKVINIHTNNTVFLNYLILFLILQ